MLQTTNFTTICGVTERERNARLPQFFDLLLLKRLRVGVQAPHSPSVNAALILEFCYQSPNFLCFLPLFFLLSSLRNVSLMLLNVIHNTVQISKSRSHLLGQELFCLKY